jgi:hypothetical protein
VGGGAHLGPFVVAGSRSLAVVDSGGGCSPYGNPPSSLTPSHRRSSSWLLPLRRRWRASLPLDVVARPEGTVDVPRRHRNVVLSRLVVM